ncbi:hypothetical protein LTR36_008511 [Oleoguttula mirabilis]|uniref:Glycosyltransferase 2-like domain-containing protein n=1 Tax=Oleoguttula mirabilis TaxID=1507867 RepID=A0AAV9JT75_9PEZI|nr:hypothetical protein LTR36_008511 [Oleoguttula mirabilis]
MKPTRSDTNTWQYTTRIVPAISVVAVVTLLVFSFIIKPYGKDGSRYRHGGPTATPWQLVLSAYTVGLHILSIVFPARVFFALGEVMARMKETASIKDDPRRRRTQSVKSEKGTTTFPDPLFVIILPAYKEEMSLLEETLRVLGSHSQARYSYHVYLAMEQKEEKSEVKAASLVKRFQNSFYKMSYTVHPQGLPGEAQGKSSNESWAAKQACKDYPEGVKRNVIVTVMDADTHLSTRYFAQIERLHVEHPDQNDTTVYMCPIVFDRNLHHVPLPVRTADLMWAGAGLSSLYGGSTVCIPTSVYSLPMTLVEHVGGWDRDPGAIGEDMHMYIKCFFALSGNLNVQVVYAAASQCNVSSDVQGLKGYLDGICARYRQALRHMWGSLDTGFAVRQTFEMFKRHTQASRARVDLPLSAPKYVVDVVKVLKNGPLTACSANWTAFYTSTGLDKSLTPKPANIEPAPSMPIHKANVLTLYQRLFEAHFLPIHLAVILTTSSIFSLHVPGFLMPEVLHIALDFAGWCRLAGFLLMLCFFYRFDTYHRLCVGFRQEEMREAGMLDAMIEHDGFSMTVFPVAGPFEACLFPLGGFIFGAIPALQAVISHVFTDRITYVVSLKPQFAIKRWAGIRP